MVKSTFICEHWKTCKKKKCFYNYDKPFLQVNPSKGSCGQWHLTAKRVNLIPITKLQYLMWLKIKGKKNGKK
jgi:hypothetical protein